MFPSSSPSAKVFTLAIHRAQEGITVPYRKLLSHQDLWVVNSGSSKATYIWVMFRNAAVR